MTGKPKVGDSEGNVAAHVRFERELRWWSTAELARYVTEAGCPISQSAVWRIESGEPRRKISVDELVAFSKVFDKQIGDLLQPPTTEYPEDVVKEYTELWLEAELLVWHQNLNAMVHFHDLVGVLAAYPGAVPRFPALLEKLSEKEHRGVVKEQVEDRLKNLQARLNAERSTVSHMSETGPLIRYWRRLGLSTEEMIAEAERLGMEGVLRGTFASDINLSAFPEDEPANIVARSSTSGERGEDEG